MASLINFVAAYGDYPPILAATTLVDKRAAALDVVSLGMDPANSTAAAGTHARDAWDFMHSLEAYANVTDPVAAAANLYALHNADGTLAYWSTGNITGLDHVDLWIGGLAEKQNLFGGLLGYTFDFIFRSQMESLQDSDRFYYLTRLEGTHFRSEIENNSFAEMIMHNTGTTHVSASVFLTPDCTVEAAAVNPDDPSSWLKNPVTGKVLLESHWVLNPDGSHATAATEPTSRPSPSWATTTSWATPWCWAAPRTTTS